MKSRDLFFAALLLALAGCAGIEPRGGQTQPPASQNASTCRGQHCEITVNVDGCVVSVDPYVLIMNSRSGPVTMTWRISGNANATFPPGAIRWKDAGAFQVFQPGPGGPRTAVAINNMSQMRVFHYGVTVMNGPTRCDELDPTGINTMP
jgi:hypothetical protein